MVTLPTDGEINWGDPLNAGINSVEAEAASAQHSVNDHTANIPADPHGDRAFAQSLVAPITTGVNGPSGYVQLNSSGTIPPALVQGLNGPGGMYSGIFDANKTYGAVPGTTDSSVKIQNALDAAASNGGGIVYVGPGTYSLGSYLVIGTNTTLLLSEGTILSRIPGGSGNPPYIISNVKFGTTNTPASNFVITGGTLDAVGASVLSSACTPVFAIQAGSVIIDNISINNVFNNPAIELNGCPVVKVHDLHLSGTGSSTTQPTVPAIRINTSSASTTPSGLAAGFYNNATCQVIKIRDCDIQSKTLTFGSYGCFAATDLLNSGHNSDHIVITGCSTKYASNGGVPIVTTQWSNWSYGNCIFSDFTTGNDGWNQATLQHGWTNTGGNNAHLQYRLLQNPPNSLEIVGDITSGTTADGTIVASTGFIPNTIQNIPITSTGISGEFFNFNLSGNIACTGIGSVGGGFRAIVHAIVSLDA